ncbi:APC family permease [Mesorhizobium sp. M8A.F.Ca.ET.173.01.1.1]|nr:APC family permease [Mesorhizobium sp. M8A.F.Ca.ET.173.01.1.1]
MSVIEASSGQLRKNAVGISHIVFFVVAAAAPLAVVVGVSPYAFATGNGTGVPLTFILVGAMYLLFSVGFTTMSAHIGGAVSFYPYIAKGLGKPMGVGGALVSIASYIAVQLMAMTLFGIFSNAIVAQYTGADIPWWIYCLMLNVVVYLCGMRNIEFSGRVLGVFMMAEVLVLSLLGVAILASGGGPEGITLAPFGFSSVSSGNLSLALVFIVSAFIGFEATAIFGEEARDPRKTIPAATYLAVAIIAVFYAFSTWVISLDYGPSNIVAAAEANFTGLYQVSMEKHLGGFAGVVLQVLMITSLFACVLSFHNTINRYFFVIAREGLLYRKMAATHAEHQSPQAAGIVQMMMVAAIVLLFAVAGLDPTVIVGLCSAFTAIGILMIQCVVSVSVIAFFSADDRGVSAWRRLIAPALSTIALAFCLYLMASNLSLVSGSESVFVKAYPVIIAGIGLVGIIFARWLRTARPETYANLGRVFN